MTTPNLPSLPVLAMHKSNVDTHAKLWARLSGKKPLLFQPLASTHRLLSSADSSQSMSVKGHLSLHRTARVRDTAVHIPLMLGSPLLQAGLLTATQPPGGSC